MKGFLSMTVAMSAALLFLVQIPAGAAMVQFDQPYYSVQPGGQVDVGIIFDFDDLTPGNQPMPEGLFCAGGRIYWDSDIAGVLNPADVVYNPGFDDTIFTMVDVQPDNAGFLAFIDFSSPPVMDTDLGHFTFTAGPDDGLMNLHLAFFYDKAGEDTMDDFLDGAGNVLDRELLFGDDGTLGVIPEPMTLLLVAGGLAGILIRRKR